VSSSFALEIPRQHPCFPGHFPGFPLVPGALLLAWIRARCEGELGKKIIAIRVCKFLAPALPGDELCVNIDDRGTGSASVVATKNGRASLKAQFIYE